jgi:hypothetical protein
MRLSKRDCSSKKSHAIIAAAMIKTTEAVAMSGMLPLVAKK